MSSCKGGHLVVILFRLIRSITYSRNSLSDKWAVVLLSKQRNITWQNVLFVSPILKSFVINPYFKYGPLLRFVSIPAIVLYQNDLDCTWIISELKGPRQANLVLIAYASSEDSGEPAHPRSLARTFAARSYKQWIKRNLQTENQIPGPSEWLDMRNWNLSWRNARRHKFAWRGSKIRIFSRVCGWQFGILKIVTIRFNSWCEPHHAKLCLRRFSTRSDSNQPAQLQKLARILKLCKYTYHTI